MYIKITANKIYFNSVKAGEDVLIKIDKIASIDNDNMQVVVSAYVNSGYPNRKISGRIDGLPGVINFAETQQYKTVGAKLIKQKLIDDLGLVDSDIEILANYYWQEDQQLRPIRVTIPTPRVIDAYSDLISYVKTEGIPYYADNGEYILYLAELYNTGEMPHRAMFEADETVIIEE